MIRPAINGFWRFWPQVLGMLEIISIASARRVYFCVDLEEAAVSVRKVGFPGPRTSSRCSALNRPESRRENVSYLM